MNSYLIGAIMGTIFMSGFILGFFVYNGDISSNNNQVNSFMDSYCSEECDYCYDVVYMDECGDNSYYVEKGKGLIFGDYRDNSKPNRYGSVSICSGVYNSVDCPKEEGVVK